MPIGAAIGAAISGLPLGFIVSGLINGCFSVHNAKKGREQQERLAIESRQLTEQLEENRQDFQLDLHYRNAELQHSLATQNHVLRLEEIQFNFENVCRQLEFKMLLDKWPLLTTPAVMREDQILPDGTVRLRVVFCYTSDQVFNRLVYPFVEHELRNFVDIYHNVFGSQNIVFYHEGFKSSVHGGAVEENLKYALKEVPVLVVDANVLEDEIHVSLTIWGFGDPVGKHQNVFSLPYERKMAGNAPDKAYYREIGEKLLTYLKFIIGYTYDAYNLILYDRTPLLPQIAAYESEQSAKCCLLNAPEITDQIGKTYKEMAFAVWHSSDSRLLLESRKCDAHKTKLEFALSLKSYITPEEYTAFLDESVTAWAALRSNLTTDVFLQNLAMDPQTVQKYFSLSDKQYWEELCEAYSEDISGLSELKNLVAQVGDSTKIHDLSLEEAPNRLISENNANDTAKWNSRFIEL